MSGAHAAAAAAYPALHYLVDGEWVGQGTRENGARSRDILDPATGRILGCLPLADDIEVQNAIDAAEAAFGRWKATPAIDRSRLLRAVAAWLRTHQEEWARLIALELGKPLPEALRETNTACEMFEWAAEEARRLYGRIIPPRQPSMRVMALPEPVGPVAAICGWNAPAVTPARKISAALAAGCTIVVKPSEETPASALMIARACEAAEVPAGVVNIIFGDPADIGRRLATHRALRAISFTGGTAVGQQLAALAGPSLKRGIFELGGHAPALIFDDCDVEAVARDCAAAKFRNSGQVCTSPTRILVQDGCYGRFVAAFVDAAAALPVGDPFDEGIRMGPVQNARRRTAVSELVEDAVDGGAALLLGGQSQEGPGFFYAPTILAELPAAARVLREEPFGPLAAVIRFETVEEAIDQANRLPFGLAAYAFTASLPVAERLGREIEAGTLAINHWTASWAETPFGGVKDSGLGSEGGAEGIAAFQQTRLVSIAT